MAHFANRTRPKAGMRVTVVLYQGPVLDRVWETTVAAVAWRRRLWYTPEGYVFALDEEGTAWAKGWDTDAAKALVSAHVLRSA